MYIISDEEKDRIKMVKFIAIIFVVYIHSYATGVKFFDGTNTFSFPIWLQIIEDGLSQVVARCGVPLFFLISAILLFKSDRSYGATIKRKIKTLLVPYLIWNTFWIMVFIVLQSLPFTAIYFSGNKTPIMQCSLIEWFGLYGIGEEKPYCYPLWFMRDLVAITLLYPIIKFVVNICPKTMFCIGVILTFIPFSLFGKEALAWFIIGAVIVKKQIHITFLDNVSMKKIFSAYFIFTLISLLSNAGVVENIFNFIGILFWMRVSKEIYAKESARNRFLWLSQWTFIIFVFHELTLSAIQKLCFRILPTTSLFLMCEYLLIPVIVVMSCIIMGIIFKKIAPKVYLFSTGGR